MVSTMDTKESGDVKIDLNFYSRFIVSGLWSLKLNASIFLGGMGLKNHLTN